MFSYFNESNDETTAPTVDLLQARDFVPPFIYDLLDAPVVLFSDKSDGSRPGRLGIVCGYSTHLRDLLEARATLLEAPRRLDKSNIATGQMVVKGCPVPCGMPHAETGDEFVHTEDMALLRMRTEPGFCSAVIVVACSDRPLVFFMAGVPASDSPFDIIEDAVSDALVAIEALDSICRLCD